MAIKYYYIDDDPQSTIIETAKGLSIHPDRLEINAYQHKNWDEQINFIIENQNSLDGLLLDWSLSNKNEEGINANYNVEALAQQLRRYIIDADKIKKDFPIVICSADYRFKEIFCQEITGHDLFDLVFEKDDFDSQQELIISQLEDLAVSYKTISNDKTAKGIFKLDNLELLDYRILDYIENQVKQPTHEIARFLLTKVINSSGILIDDYLLASRLGIDIVDNKDLNEWFKLLEILDKVRYKGVFSIGWSRWWMSKLNNFWEENFNCTIGSLSGEKRVQLLNEKFELNLIPAVTRSKSTSDDFWVICKKTKYPLSYDDAILSTSDVNKSSWEEDEYFSIDSALIEDIKNIHVLEKDRVKKLKELHTKVRQNERK
jgi:hypothetical protein